MNDMVFKLQPDIIVNNRNKLDGDFATPEQRIQADKRAWESCMTMNDSWGYQRADDDWKTPKTIVRNLITCARDGGNYLLNIGPKADGSIPEESVRILTAVGKWMDRNGDTIYQSEMCQPRRSNYAELHAQRQHAVHARAFLARLNGSARRLDEHGEIGAPAGQRQGSEVRAGQVPRAFSRICPRTLPTIR